MSKKDASLRQRILTFVGALIFLSLMGSALSLYRITEVNRSLERINRVSMPFGRLLTQMQSDAELLRREQERRLGSTHWSDPHWKAKPVPSWLNDVIEGELGHARDLLEAAFPGSSSDPRREQWEGWISALSSGYFQLKSEGTKLYETLDRNDQAGAAQLYPHWNAASDEWTRQLQWGIDEYEHFFRQDFATAQSRVSQLRGGLEIILVVVIALSLLLLWLGERALRPMAELTRLARDITRRGLRKEDKERLPKLGLTPGDEVGTLAREFYHMATALLEREKTVESQTARLQEQNRLLRDMGELNENVLLSIRSALIVTDLSGRITQCNPVAANWLGAPKEAIIGNNVASFEKLCALLDLENFAVRIQSMRESERIPVRSMAERAYAGRLMPLTGEDDLASGAILVIDDITEEIELEERLKRAENLAAIGRMSAQVAHEVRNPLHSIGLEADMAAERAMKLGDPALKTSFQSILASVDRLEKITQNYLKLSKLSTGKKLRVEIGSVLESVLATYAHDCEKSGVSVDWSRSSLAPAFIFGDPDLLEQAFGNLFKNSLQALRSSETIGPRIVWKIERLESGRILVEIQDNGPGLAPEIRNKLFTPFVTTRAEGTGLGLSFIKQVIEDHGGTIDLVETEGACFRICLSELEHEACEGARPGELNA